LVVSVNPFTSNVCSKRLMFMFNKIEYIQSTSVGYVGYPTTRRTC